MTTFTPRTGSKIKRNFEVTRISTSAGKAHREITGKIYIDYIDEMDRTRDSIISFTDADEMEALAKMLMSSAAALKKYQIEYQQNGK
jgi:hypothetical protein